MTRWRSCSRKDHPRSRGEYQQQTGADDAPPGSSPLSRGIRTACSPGCAPAGIIPALAGNTPSGTTSVTSSRDHPRSRGEYRALQSRCMSAQGSSPLSRGIPVAAGHERPVGGIIPALAGNTFALATRTGGSWDHPRSRGEYPTGNPGNRSPVGSSPLSRGILVPRWRLALRRGIIPALAGNTACLAAGARASADHPRSRGEYSNWFISRLKLRGSSPLSRGILRVLGVRFVQMGIIPALAGNTRPPRIMPRPMRDHPRSRGEYRVETTTSHADTGSSPLSRGILEARI